MAWDEDPERPGTKVITFAVLPADRTPLENLGASLAGEEANPVIQLSLLVFVLLLVVLFSRRRRRVETPSNVWDEVSDALAGDLFTDREERLRQKRPEGPPPDYLFQQALQNAPALFNLPQALHRSHPQDYQRDGPWNNGSITGNSGSTPKLDAPHGGHSLLYQKAHL